MTSRRPGRSGHRTRIALVAVSSLLAVDALAWGNGCSSDDGQGGNTPLLDCTDGGCGSASSNGGAPGPSGTGAGTGDGTGTGDDDGSTTSGTGGGISDGGGSGNILPTDTGSTGSLPTNTE